MATYIKNHYDITHKIFKRFEELMPENVIINQWYSIGNNSFIYYNSKGYYHMATLKKNQLGLYFDDYILQSDMELTYSKSFSYFKTHEAVKEFLKSKGNID